MIHRSLRIGLLLVLALSMLTMFAPEKEVKKDFW